MAANPAPGPSTTATTQAVDDYLKVIFALTREGGSAATGNIAAKLGIAPASVTAMVKRLAALDPPLVTYTKSRGASLTIAGRARALEIIRHHRLIETFLHDILGIPFDQVHEEAERLEHHISESLEDAIARHLGDPVVDPHGAPIPRKNGEMPELDSPSLVDLPEGSDAVVERVFGAADLLAYLAGIGVVAGARVRFLGREPFGGPVNLRIGAQQRGIAPEVARQIRVRRGFTLIELLVVVAIVAILAAIALVNFRLASERSLKAADAANLKAIATALAMYHADYNTLPPGDREAGPFPSHSRSFTATGNGPAAGGSWDGVPWLLLEQRYLSDPNTLFNPKYRRRYQGGETIRGGHPRIHNFRYAYNASALSSGGVFGGTGNANSGEVWIVRNLFVGPQDGWYGNVWPSYPADYDFPWGEGAWENRLEHAMYADFAVRTVVGGTDLSPDDPRAQALLRPGGS